MSSARDPFKYSYFQLTFGQEEAYLRPHVTYDRLTRCGYDAIEICPPKGRYGMGLSMEDHLSTHRQLKADFGLEVSNVNECWGEMWDPYSPDFKTLTEPKTAELAPSIPAATPSPAPAGRRVRRRSRSRNGRATERSPHRLVIRTRSSATVEAMAQVEERSTMLEAHEVADGGAPTDRLALAWEARRRSRQKATTENGRQIGLFLPRGTVLRSGTLLRATDGTTIEIVAAPEDVSTIATPDAVLLARVAYHLGNRHVRTQVGPGFIRYRHDRAIDELMRKLGAEVAPEEVPFEPERDTRDHAHDHDLAS